MDKRTFLKKSAIGAGGVLAISSFSAGKAAGKILKQKHLREFKLTDLPYAYNALEPYVDEETLRLHHLKYHADYVAGFNQAVRERGLNGKSAKEILSSVSAYPDSIRIYGGGFFNHRVFWRILTPNGGGLPGEKLLAAICDEFGSFDNFKNVFSQTAENHSGSGWIWLILTGRRLNITTTFREDNPIMDIAETRGRPILMIDMCDHAYNTGIQDGRNRYINNFWNIVNWEFVSDKYNRLIRI